MVSRRPEEALCPLQQTENTDDVKHSVPQDSLTK